VVKDYVRQARLRYHEVFVPLAHPPGDAQSDFGEAFVMIAGVEQKARRCPHPHHPGAKSTIL
jgi:hypothetical protein